MYITVRTIDLKIKFTIDISRNIPVKDLKEKLKGHLGIEPEDQKLFFRGKQLADEYTCFDYGINVNDVVQVMQKPKIDEMEKPKTNATEAESSDGLPSTSAMEPLKEDPELAVETFERSEYFQVGELVDSRNNNLGAWFEGKISKIFKNKKTNDLKDNNVETDQSKEETENKENLETDKKEADENLETDKKEDKTLVEDDYLYEIEYRGEEGEESEKVVFQLKDLRPRSREKVTFTQLKVGDKILANYNFEVPTQRGCWYDCIVTDLKSNRKGRTIKATVLKGTTPILDCSLAFKDELFRIQENKLLSEREVVLGEEPPARLTEIPMSCDHCKNNTRRNCKECGCRSCGMKTNEDKQILCDKCKYGFHFWCLKPPLDAVPHGDWYCPDCKNDKNEIVSAGGKLKDSKKKAKMASSQSTTSRDWGKGMACVGRTKKCTIVPEDHFGPIPGIEVGTSWKFRIQVSEAGVHRPHVAGIHGRESVGAFSVVLSGGYEDDIDKGEEFWYTGSGGRDLSGNKRTSNQSFDQTLTRLNKAIALNCDAPLNEKGAKAKDWRRGKPIRVVRNFKLAKHSKYAPEEGNRYDGIYKVVKYWHEKGQSGFKVWRFLFRRDDPAPAPWTKEGKERIESLGLTMELPEGQEGSVNEANDGETSTGKGRKRVLEDTSNTPKTSKKAKYELESDLLTAIEKDKINTKLWEDCKVDLDNGKKKFVAKVEENFSCIVCTELVFKPITTDCLHNICYECLKRSFQAEVMTCPTCRNPLDKEVLKTVNTSLQSALDLLFPGYSKNR